jgi:tetratricopeptide (TPR) repeat protein
MSGGVVDRDLVRLLEEALAALGEHAPALRARLLARLAMELSFSEQRERRAELSGEAVEISRRVDDTKALGFALVARHWSLWGPRNVDERQTTADDLLRLAERSGDVRLAMQGHRWRMMVLLELGEIDEVDLEIEAHRAVASRRRRLSDMVYVELYDAMRLLIAGAFDEAEAASRELRRLGERVQDSNAESAHLLQMLALRRERGGVEELEQMVRARAESVQTIPGWRCVLALLHAETGRHDEARRALEELSSAEFRVLPLDGIWLGAIAHLSEAAAAVGDGERAEVLYRLLQPYADRNIVIAWAAVCAGSASRHLGLLAAVLGRPGQAIAHFEDALAMNERMRARPLVARTQLELAQLLLADGGDHERARDLLDSGLKEAEALGMPRLLEAGRQVRMEAMAGGARR